MFVDKLVPGWFLFNLLLSPLGSVVDLHGVHLDIVVMCRTSPYSYLFELGVLVIPIDYFQQPNGT